MQIFESTANNFVEIIIIGLEIQWILNVFYVKFLIYWLQIYYDFPNIDDLMNLLNFEAFSLCYQVEFTVPLVSEFNWNFKWSDNFIHNKYISIYSC